MRTTTVKQIKFNRGQVTDLLSERVDMGLQNACGTVYDNVYINTYGQLLQSPMLRFASHSAITTEPEQIRLFDTGTDLFYVIAPERGRRTYYAYTHTISITISDVVYTYGGTDDTGTLYKFYPPQGGESNAVYTTTLSLSAGMETTSGETIDSVTKNTAYITKKATGGAVYVLTDDCIIRDGSRAVTNISDDGAVATIDGLGIATIDANAQIIIENGKQLDATIDESPIPDQIYGIAVYGPLSKSDPTRTLDWESPAVQAINTPVQYTIKGLQIQSSMIMYSAGYPYALQITPYYANLSWDTIKLKVKPNYFVDSFNTIYMRYLAEDEAPSDFTVPTSGYYQVTADQTVYTDSPIITISRNGAGGVFTQSLVGQVIDCTELNGVVQVLSVESDDLLTAKVLSQLITPSTSEAYLRIRFNNNKAHWVFGYTHVFDYDSTSAPEVCNYVNQRLIFANSYKFPSAVAVSRVGVLNDFDDSSQVESSALAFTISSAKFCKINASIVTNQEVRFMATDGEYAVPLSALTPSEIISQGVQIRSNVGSKLHTPACDCGGITAYANNDGTAIYGTQFSLLLDRYAPISLSSQTSGIVNNTSSLHYLINRLNGEPNCLVGLNDNNSMFISNMDTNNGLLSYVRLNNFAIGSQDGRVSRLYSTDNVLLGIYELYGANYLIRFSSNEMFDFPCVPNADGDIIVPGILQNYIFNNASSRLYRALYNGTLIAPTGYTDNDDGTLTLMFDESVTTSDIVVCGFIRQGDWRSVELGIGMGTRELNKQIIKLSAVLDTVKFRGGTDTVTPTHEIAQADIWRYFNLVDTKDAETLTADEIDNPTRRIYYETDGMAWQRGIDHPKRTTHYGFTLIAPLVVKSITATVQYDEVQ